MSSDNETLSEKSFSEESVTEAITRQPPLSLKIDYEDNMLTLQWDFKAVQAVESSSTRHLLVVNFEGMAPYMEPVALIKAFYKMLPLGDFVRVVDISSRRRSPWYEKTGCDLDLVLTPTSQSLPVLLRKVFEAVPNYHQRFVPVLFVGDYFKLPLTLPQQLLKELQKSNCQNELVLFRLDENVAGRRAGLPSVSIPTLTYDFYDQASLLSEVKRLMAAHASVRVRSVDITLRCSTGELHLSRLPQLKWQQEDEHAICRRITSLNNGTIYRENLLLEAVSNRHLDFQVQFRVELCDWSRFEMTRNFTVVTCRKSKNQLNVPEQQAHAIRQALFVSEREARSGEWLTKVTVQLRLTEENEITLD